MIPPPTAQTPRLVPDPPAVPLGAGVEDFLYLPDGPATPLARRRHVRRVGLAAPVVWREEGPGALLVNSRSSDAALFERLYRQLP